MCSWELEWFISVVEVNGTVLKSRFSSAWKSWRSGRDHVAECVWTNLENPSSRRLSGDDPGRLGANVGPEFSGQFPRLAKSQAPVNSAFGDQPFGRVPGQAAQCNRGYSNRRANAQMSAHLFLPTPRRPLRAFPPCASRKARARFARDGSIAHVPCSCSAWLDGAIGPTPACFPGRPSKRG